MNGTGTTARTAFNVRHVRMVKAKLKSSSSPNAKKYLITMPANKRCFGPTKDPRKNAHFMIIYNRRNFNELTNF